MKNQISFTCTTLAGTGKKGVLRPDQDGYYYQPVGALNCFNSAGEYYTYEAARQLFEESSALMRRVSTGCLKSEEGHPKMEIGMSEQQYLQRVMRIEEKNVCAHIAQLDLDFNSLKDQYGRPIIAIMGKIKPSGPLGDSLQKSYENGKEEVCFSIRAFTNDRRVSGVVHRELVEVVTFDRVTEPGIFTSKKFHSPGLESLEGGHKYSMENFVEATKPIAGLAMENNSFDTYSLFKSMGWDTSHLAPPSYMKW